MTRSEIGEDAHVLVTFMRHGEKYILEAEGDVVEFELDWGLDALSMNELLDKGCIQEEPKKFNLVIPLRKVNGIRGRIKKIE